MAQCMTMEDYEHFLHGEIIETEWAFLCDNIQPQDHLDYFRSKRLFDEDIVEEIMSQSTRKAKCRCFLQYIKQGGPTAFPIFLDSLMENRTQLFVLKRLHISLEKLRQEPPLSVLKRKPRSPEENDEHILYPIQTSEQNEDRYIIHGQSVMCQSSIEAQLPVPGEPGAIPLPDMTS